MFILYLLLSSCILLYFILNVYIYFERRKYKHFKSPPIPISPIWFLGVLPEFANYAKKSDKVIDEFYKTYGWDVFVLPIISRNIIFCMDLGVISKVCNDRVTFPKNDLFVKVVRSVAGVRYFGKHGLLSEPGTDIWHAKRSIMEPAFHKAFLRTIMADLNFVTNNLMSQLHEKRAQTFDITEELCQVALESISVCGFNWDQDLLKKHGKETLKLASTLFNVLTLAFKEHTTFNLPWSRREEKKEIRTSLTRMRHILRAHLLDRLNNPTYNEKEDILSYIFRSNQCSDELTMEDVVDEYLVFISAGMETTAISMAITLFYMSVHPDVYRKVQQEVDEVFGDKDELNFEDLNDLVYLEMVIREGLRLKPPVRETVRKCNKDNVVINGTYLPKGAILFVPIGALHTNPRYWDNPREFDPERFAPKAKRNIKSFTYMPFMLGQRKCIGKNFAMLEMKTVISRIVREFVVENPCPEVKDIETVGAITSRPSDGVVVRLLPRNV